MIARSGETRRRHLRICALAMGPRRQGRSLLYERVLRKEKQLDLWVERCKSQIAGVLEVLEKERAAVKSPIGPARSSAQPIIAVACVLRFTGEAHPALFDARYHRAAAGAAEGVRAFVGWAKRSVPTVRHDARKMVGTAQTRLCPPYFFTASHFRRVRLAPAGAPWQIPGSAIGRVESFALHGG
jgi:hypothetical protein